MVLYKNRIKGTKQGNKGKIIVAVYLKNVSSSCLSVTYFLTGFVVWILDVHSL